MENHQDPFTFAIKPLIEQKHFSIYSPSQGFLDEWFRINDSIKRHSITRVQWEKRLPEELLEKQADGTQILFLPFDGLQLWEMIPVMTSIDQNTFADKSEEKQQEAFKKMKNLGEIIKNAGIYLASRLDTADKGHHIGEVMACDFYSYGKAICDGKKQEDVNVQVEHIQAQQLTSEQTQQIDVWLSTGKILSQSDISVLAKYMQGNTDLTGEEKDKVRSMEMILPSDNVYIKALKKGLMKEDGQKIEAYRTGKVVQFFRTAEHAFNLNNRQQQITDSFSQRLLLWFAEKAVKYTGKDKILLREIEVKKTEAWNQYQQYIGRYNLSAEEETRKKELESVIFTLRPWESTTSARSAFLQKIQKNIAKEIEAPKRELVGSIFRRGMELLVQNIGFDKLEGELLSLQKRRKDGEQLSEVDHVNLSRLKSFVEIMKHWQKLDYKTLREALQIDKLKLELTDVRIKKGDPQNALKFAERCERLAEIYGDINNTFGREIRVIGYDYNANTRDNLDPTPKIERLRGLLPDNEIQELENEFNHPNIISNKEREIAGKIQQAVSLYPYKASENNPSDMIANQYINCVGASMLGGALFQDVGINYLVGNLPTHSILILVTSDSKLEWRDMQSTGFNKEITKVEGKVKGGKSFTIDDIVAYSKNPSPGGLRFYIKNDLYRVEVLGVKTEQRNYLTVYMPEIGQQIQVIFNSGLALQKFDRNAEAIEMYNQVIGIDPTDSLPCNQLGIAFASLGDQESNTIKKKEYMDKAIESYRRAILIDPTIAFHYDNLGRTLFNLGHKEEAIEAYRKYISIADIEKDKQRIKRAEDIIQKSQI